MVMSGDSSKTRLRETVTQAVDALPPDLRAPVLLRYREKFSYEEIARRLSLPDDGVRGRICTAALRLHATFGMHIAGGHAILPEPGVTTSDCRSIEKHIPRFVEQGGADPESRSVETHISKCRSCLEMVARFRAVWNLLQSTYQSASSAPKDGVLRSPFAVPAREESFDSTFGLGALLGMPPAVQQPVAHDGPVDPATAAAELAKMLGMGQPPAPIPLRVERPAAPAIEVEPDPSSKVFDSTVTVTPLPLVGPPVAIELKIVPETSPHVEPQVIRSPEPALPAREPIAPPVAPVAPVANIQPPPVISAPVVVANAAAQITAMTEAQEKPEAKKEEKKEPVQPVPISFFERMRQNFEGAPFWFVSFALHGLLIALAALISMTIKSPFDDEKIIILTELSHPAETEELEAQVKMNLASALAPHVEDLAHGD